MNHLVCQRLNSYHSGEIGTNVDSPIFDGAAASSQGRKILAFGTDQNPIRGDFADEVLGGSSCCP
jgi:hypothetical protein